MWMRDGSLQPPGRRDGLCSGVAKLPGGSDGDNSPIQHGTSPKVTFVNCNIRADGCHNDSSHSRMAGQLSPVLGTQGFTGSARAAAKAVRNATATSNS